MVGGTGADEWLWSAGLAYLKRVFSASRFFWFRPYKKRPFLQSKTKPRDTKRLIAMAVTAFRGGHKNTGGNMLRLSFPETMLFKALLY